MRRFGWVLLCSVGMLWGCSEEGQSPLEGVMVEGETEAPVVDTPVAERSVSEEVPSSRSDEEELPVEEVLDEELPDRQEDPREEEERRSEDRIGEEELPAEEPPLEEVPDESAPSEEEPEAEEEVEEEPTPSGQQGPSNPASSATPAVSTEELVVELFEAIEAPRRPRKRMNIEQLDRAIEQVTGGIRWKDNPGDEESLFEELSLSLGQPDFLELTSEDVTPGALFQKFLSDAARKVCQELLEHEVEVAASERVFLTSVDPTMTLETHPQEVTENLMALASRFHGHQWTSESPALAAWLWLFESATHVAGDPAVAWETVCVALIQHPDFYTY